MPFSRIYCLQVNFLCIYVIQSSVEYIQVWMDPVSFISYRLYLLRVYVFLSFWKLVISNYFLLLSSIEKEETLLESWNNEREEYQAFCCRLSPPPLSHGEWRWACIRYTGRRKTKRKGRGKSLLLSAADRGGGGGGPEYDDRKYSEPLNIYYL